MTKLLLSLHVLAALVAIGRVTVAASMFPTALRRAHDHPDGQSVVDTPQLLHRICRVYSGIGIAVPLFGFATASSLGVLGSGWLIASITPTAAAAALLALRILPAQEAALAAATAPRFCDLRRATGRLALLAGVFNLLWAAVTVLMIVRPGSTTGA